MRRNNIKDLDIKVNNQIKFKEVRLIGENGEQIGILPSSEALKIAKERGLDLVLVSPNANPPVCRIMDYGKHKYDLEKKQREQKKKQHIVNVKELTVSYKIGEHDYQVRLKSIKRFIENGDKVKITVKLRGREEQHSDLAIKLLNRFLEDVKDIADPEKEPKKEGKNIFMILQKKKEKKNA